MANAAAPSERTLLQESDLTFAGMFFLPESFGGGGFDATAGRGLAFRYVDGALRVFSTVYRIDVGFDIFEAVVPESLGMTFNTAPSATLLRNWGFPSPVVSGINNLYWDSVDSLLYFTGGDTYIDNGTFMCFGRVPLNDGNGTFGTSMVWRLDGRSSKFCMHGITPVPQWFQDANCPGMRLALGFGGYESEVAAGPASLGHAVTAFNPEQLGSSGSALSSAYWKSLVGFPYNPNPYTAPTRQHRDNNYNTQMANFPYWNPQGATGYWAEQDYIQGGGCWVDTLTKSGFVGAAVMGNGDLRYVSSDLEAQSTTHARVIYAPANFALVAQGGVGESEIQPSSYTLVEYPDITYPMAGWRALPEQLITGSWFDAETSLYYVSVKHPQGNIHPTPNPQVVYAYQVAA